MHAGLVEACGFSRQSNISSGFNLGTALGPGGTRSKRVASRAKGREIINCEALTRQLIKYPCTPIMNIVKTLPWLENEDLCFIRENDERLKIATDVLMAKVCSWNFYDFRILYKSHNTKPLWSSLTIDLNNTYYDTENSLSVLKEFLEFQFNDREHIVQFLQDVHNVCERRIPKLNSIVVVSPPSGGKNWFFDMILAFYWNKGQMGNPNKHNTFAYQECVGKRILLWNEPNYESAETDMLKMILGGDNYNVKVKYKQDMAVYRTPVIVLSNKMVPFMYDPAFEDRIRLYNWMTAPLLKDKDSKPLPSAWVDLLEYYDIE